MLHIVSAMGFGDCMLTLSLLEDIDLDARGGCVIGTGVTAAVSALMRRPVPVVELLSNNAAFYTIKEHGLRAALRDFLVVRRELARRARPGDVFAFERAGLRNRAVTPPRNRAVYAPHGARAYLDRQGWIRELLGSAPEWQPVQRPRSAVRQVLVNPCARFQHRWLDPQILQNLFAIGRDRGWSVTLLDPCRRYGSLKGEVGQYSTGKSLREAAEILRGCDLYVGPDSFFIHLAYYFRIPFFGFFFPWHHYFLPPGSDELRNFTDFESALKRPELEAALSAFTG